MRANEEGGLMPNRAARKDCEKRTKLWVAAFSFSFQYADRQLYNES
jgi:hypothetical protein